MTTKKKKNNKVNNVPKTTQTGAGSNTQKPSKQKDGGRKGQRKKTHAKKKANRRNKDPSKMCWDLFPLFAYDVKDVNKKNKNILLVITCILWCFSIVTVGLGAHLISQRKSRQEIISAANFSDYWLNFSLVLLCNGLLSSIITFCGCIGVLRENIPLLRVFYISLMVILLLKFSFAVFVLVFADYSRPLLERMLAEQAVDEYRSSSDVETLMDYLQVTFRCCGLRDDGFQDWSRSVYFNCSEGSPSPERCGVPWSCCRNGTGITNPLCGHGVQKLDRNIASRTIYTMGCLHALQLWAYAHACAVGLLVLLEVSAVTAVIFQCTRMVNELQMLTGVYRGPWWEWISKPRPPPPPPGTPPTPTEPRHPPPGGSSVIQIGRGPAVRRTRRLTPAQPQQPPTIVVVDPEGQ